MDRPPGRGAVGGGAAVGPDAPRRRRRRHVRARDIAVMYRTNAQSRAIEEAFLRYGHPLPARRRDALLPAARGQGRAGVPADPAQRHGPGRASSGSSTCPARGIGEQDARGAAARWPRRSDGRRRPGARIDRGRDAARSPRRSASADARTARSADFAALVRRLRARIGVLPLPELLDAVLEESGYRAMLADGSEEGEERWANLLELRVGDDPLRRPVAGGRAGPAPRGDRARRRPGLVRGRARTRSRSSRSTRRRAWSSRSSSSPGWRRASSRTAGRSTTSSQLEEERRLAYVGITRAKRRLFLSHAWRRATWGRGGPSVPSRFLLEIPAELMVGPQLWRATSER